MDTTRWTLWLAVSLSVIAGCGGAAEESPSLVKDLRVLGIRLESPELMAPNCALHSPDALPEEVDAALAAYAVPVTFTALIADAPDRSRDIRYELFACASMDDRRCEREEERALLASGTARPGELELSISPGTAIAADGTPIWRHALQQDAAGAFDRIKLPLVLKVGSGQEVIFAQKILPLTCASHPEMEPNRTPVMPGVAIQGEPWMDDRDLVLTGAGPFELAPEDFFPARETYLAPNDVPVLESWRVAWYTTLGTISPEETGLDSGNGPHTVLWVPTPGAPAQHVTFWVVVRDDRGGLSWLTRTARHEP